MSPTRVDLGMAGEREIGPDADAVAALQLEPERLDELVALQAGAPDERVRLELRRRTSSVTRVGETDATDRAGHHLDGALLERLRRVLADVRLEHREELRARPRRGSMRACSCGSVG